jgi:uncharacterized protein (TIGR03032 family)
MVAPASLWKMYGNDWRHPAQVVNLWPGAKRPEAPTLAYKAVGHFWDILDQLKVTLLVGREYEHLLTGFSYRGKPTATFHPMPHPSGIAVDSERGRVFVASTRSPNQLVELAPIKAVLRRTDVVVRPPTGAPLVPVHSHFLPGCLYLHDLAFVGNQLHGNAVAHNAIVRFDRIGSFTRVWWPACIDSRRGPRFDLNLLQLNSIAAGRTLKTSYFTASIARPHRRRPGDKDFPVDRRGVVFSGLTRETICGGLTRPHSARLHDGQVWLDNSGYGELGVVSAGKFEVVSRLPGWTRGLLIRDGIAFVGTSRVIPRFRQYAPGLDRDRHVCAVHAVELSSGRVLGALLFPGGNQIFAIEAIASSLSTGFAFDMTGTRNRTQEFSLFYAFDSEARKEHPNE